MSEQDPAYEVGYGKPPKNGRFSKGKSGNPTGRPKGSKNLANVILRESRQKVIVNGPKGKRRVAKVEATVMQLVNKAAQGHLPSQREFLALLERSEGTASSYGAPSSMHENDQRVMQNLLSRIKRAGAETASTTSPAEGKESQ
jgi:hypothetical protein